MKLYTLKVLILVIAGLFYPAYSMEVIDDSELSNVAGREGIAVDLSYTLNTTATSDRITSCDESSIINRCFLALQFANREDATGTNDEWFVLKGLFVRLNIENLFLDGIDMPTTNTAFYDPSRFEDESGTPLIPGSSPTGLPAIKFSFPGTIANVANESDIRMHVNIPRAAIEYGDNGFQNDANGSFLGFRMGDISAGLGGQASMDIDGRVTMYGF